MERKNPVYIRCRAKKRKGKNMKRMKRRISIAIASIMLAMQFCQPAYAYAKTTAETDQTTTSDNMVQENAAEENIMSDTSSSLLYDDYDEISVYTSMENQNTDTNKVSIDDAGVAICGASKYKKWDYSFLKSYAFSEGDEAASNYAGALRPFDNVEEMKKCDAMKMKVGTIVKTSGYYEKGDGGAATYVLTKGNYTNQSSLIALDNGLYAMILPDVKTIEGEKCAIINIKQYGAREGTEYSCQDAINNACQNANRIVREGIDTDADGTSDITINRAIVYIPEGEYKITDYIRAYNQNVTLIGEADRSIIYTDNDYRKESWYSEFLFEVQGGNNAYFANFVIEAREVDLYHYMRQFVLFYCDNVYIDNVDLLIPQTTYNCYYYEDKQYSNFCCYSGNKNITVDGCKMVQMSGTYRGANVGVLDLYSAGEENITIMNCDLYGNARDEQIGVFGTEASSSHIKNVDFINNTVHFYEPKYVENIGNATMRVTIAYSDSNDVQDVRFAGNHFIAECDSKFITFGKCRNVVLEQNIFEVVCTYATWSMVFDSSNDTDDGVEIKNNEFYLTSYEGKGKGNIIGGKLNFHDNKVVCDTSLTFGVRGDNLENNQFLFIHNLGSGVAGGCFSANCNLKNNEVIMYNGHTCASNLLAFNSVNETEKKLVTNNTFINYGRAQRNRKDGAYRGAWDALIGVSSSIDTVEFSNNTYLAPNYYYKGNFGGGAYGTGSIAGKENYYRLFYYRTGTEQEGKRHTNNIIAHNNTLQGVFGITAYWGDNTTNISFVDNETHLYDESLDDNTYIEPNPEKTDEVLCSKVDITKDGQVVKEIDVTGDSVTVDRKIMLATNVEYNDDGSVLSNDVVEDTEKTKDVDWISSVDSIASVVENEDGTVTLKRNLYGDVKLMCVPKDGSGVWGTLVVHFTKAKAERVETPLTEITLQPGRKHYTDFTVYPAEASQTLIWESSDESIATVNNRGRITGKAVGECDITGTTADGTGKSITIHVKVEELTVKKIDMDKWFLVYDADQIGETVQIGVKSYTPSDATNKGISRWESSNPKVCSVNQKGLVTIKGSGKCYIRAYSMDESVYGTVPIYVKADMVKNLKQTATNTEVALTFEECALEGTGTGYGYQAYMYNEGTGEWDLKYSGKDTSITIGNLQPNTTYQFKVLANITGWDTGVRVEYLGKEAVIEATTCEYRPVTTFSLYGGGASIPVQQNTEATVTVNYNKSANYPDLSFDVKVSDDSVAEVRDVTYSGGNINVKLYGKKVGYAELLITAKDENCKSASFPIGVYPGKKLTTDNNIQAVAGYKSATISFKGLEDESLLDGYMILNLRGMGAYEIKYVAKNELSDYKITITNEDKIKSGGGEFVEGEEYAFKIVPCITDGKYYYHQSGGAMYIFDANNSVSCTMPVMVDVTDVTFSESKYQVAVGKNLSVSVNLAPADASVKKVDYTLENPSLAVISREEGDTVKASAVITGQHVGITTLRADATDCSDKRGETTLVVLPAKVDGVITASQTNRIDLAWEEQEGVDGYYVYRKAGQADYEKIADVTDLNAGTGYIDEEVQEDNSYTYQIEAYFVKDGQTYVGERSNEVTVKAANEPFDSTIIIAGYQGEYDGESHEAVTVNGLKKKLDQVYYSIDQNNWTKEVPSVKNVADSKTIYVKVCREGIEEPLCRSVLAVVSQTALEREQFSLKQSLYAYTEESVKPVVLSGIYVIEDDYTVAYPDEEKTGAGKRQVVIYGTGNYKGNFSLTYEVAEAEQNVPGNGEGDETQNVTGNNEQGKEQGENKNGNHSEIGKTFESNNLRCEITSAETVKVIGVVDKKKTSATVPAQVRYNGLTYNVTAIGDKAFYGCKKLKSVTIESRIETIGKSAFASCSALRKVTFKGTVVTVIGTSCFKDCKKLTTINLQKLTALTAISDNCFYGCKELKKITIPSGVKTIGKKAFYGSSKLKTVTFKSTKIKKVGSKAFCKIKKGATIKLQKKNKKSIKKLLNKKYDKTTKVK